MLKLNCKGKRKDRFLSLSEGQTNTKYKKPKIQNLKNQFQKQKEKIYKNLKMDTCKKRKTRKIIIIIN